jgi:hypothetical protein
MEKVYQKLDESLKKKLENQTFFTAKWLVSEVAERYQLSTEAIEKICERFDLPLVEQKNEKYIVMYKPSIFEHPLTKKRSLQINLFELPTLNLEMRKFFMDDYRGKNWFWHRFVWKMNPLILSVLERIYIIFASLFYSPREAFTIARNKLKAFKASREKGATPPFNAVKVGSCFNDKEVTDLARLIRSYYSSCLWKKGDILLVDNRLVAHAGMPGSGPRLIRAMICNPLEMKYSFSQPGYLQCKDRASETIGYYMASRQAQQTE